MGKVWMAGAGGGGASSDECTATAGDVLKGQTYVGADTNDEVGTGTLELTGNAADGSVLNGKTYYNTDAKTKRTGTMPDNTSRTSNGNVPGLNSTAPNNPTRPADYMWLTTNTDGAKTLNMSPPAGYYNGNGGSYVNRPASELGTVQPINVLRNYTFTSQEGLNIKGTMPHLSYESPIQLSPENSTKVLACDGVFMGNNTDGALRICTRYMGDPGYIVGNTLFGAPASSFGTVEAKHVVQGGTFTSANGGVNAVGTLQVYSLVSFSVATYSTTQVTATWTWPTAGPYSGVAICGKTGGYPANIGDSRLYTGAGSNHNLGATTSVIIGGLQPGQTYYFAAWVYCNTNNGDMYSACRQATAATKPQGKQTFTSSGTFTVPAGITSIDVFCVGGGQSGAPGTTGSNYVGGPGGGSGYTATKKGIMVSPGQQYAVTVGAGGKCNISGSSYGFTGPGTSSFGSILSAAGGKSNPRSSNDGGSGGGPGADDSSSRPAGYGGSDGGDGQWTYSGCDQGSGQGTTTRAFGESGNTLYAGGGGGSGSRDSQGGAAGGSGGGGAGAGSGGNGVNGTSGTGSGGGASGGRSAGLTQPGAGGSGCVIVRWGY